MLDKYIVEEGNKRNIMVYDCDAPRGEFTLRLAALLCCVARRNKPQGHIEAVYVPEEIEYDESLTTGGIYIIPDKRLNIGGELHTYFVEELDGTFPRSSNDGDGADRYLCVAVAPNVTLFGSIP